MIELESAELSMVERNELAGYEQVIERGLQTFYEVGQALMDIRDKSLYREYHTTFEAYCNDRWGMSGRRAYQLIDASLVFNNVNSSSHLPPTTEAQTRPLVKLQPEQQREVWQAVVDAVGEGKITAAHVEATVKRIQNVNQGLLSFPIEYRESIEKLCGDNDEKVSILQRLYKSAGSPETNGTFDETLTTGGFHYGDEMDKWLNYTTATVEEISKALDSIMKYHASFNYKRDTKSNRMADEYVPQGYDACQTPAYALTPLLPYLKRHWIIWEPAHGEGLLTNALESNGLKVVTSDILTSQNFFDYEPDGWTATVTNPPFSLKYKWMERCYLLGKPFALLLPVETLGAKTGQELFRQYGLELVLMDKRINFKMPNKGWDGGGAQFPVAWFTWGLNIGSQMTFARIENGDHE